MTALPCLSRRMLLVLGGAAPLAGCLPAPHGTYYQPTVATGFSKPLRAHCGGQAGPTRGLEFEAEPDLPVRIEVRPGPDGEDVVVMSLLQTPPGDYRFEHDRLRLDERELAARHRAWAVSAQPVDARVDPQAVAPSPAALPAAGWGGEDARVQLAGHGERAWPTALPARLRLHWPAVRWTDGPPARWPPLDLRARQLRGWTHFQSEAQVQELLQRNARCLRETPGRHCQSLLDDTGQGFEMAPDGLLMRGRLFATGLGAAPLKLQWAVLQQRPGPWRWDGQPLRVEDPDTGRMLELPLAAQQLSVVQSGLPLSTPWVSRPDSPVSLRTEMPLPPQGRAGYSLRLPALWRDSRRLALPEVRLERRSLEAGWLPFNC